MKIIRFFLSNLILIVFFCGIIYAYYYWDNLTGEDTPAGHLVAYLSKEFKSVEAFVDGIRVKQDDERSSPVVAASAVAVSTDTSKLDADMKDQAVSEVKEDVFVTPEIEQSLNQPVTASVLNRPDKRASVSGRLDNRASVSNGSDNSAIASELNADEDPNRAIWIDARKAFYKRNYESSISNYRQLIANSTDNYDAYGELGNVYFNQGLKSEAAGAYYEAASILIKLGHQRRAQSLLTLLNYLDTEKAEKLREQLNAGQS